FDERFPRAYREDADLGLRVVHGGWGIVTGQRVTEHPVRHERWWASAARQRGNADDALMHRLPGPSSRADARAPAGRFARHLCAPASLVVALGAAASGRRRAAALAAGVYAAAVAELAAARIRPGPRSPAEVSAMAATSTALPLLAVGHRA